MQKDLNNSKKEDKIKETLKSIFKKNQLVLLTLALMLVTAGYMNYNNNNNELNITLAELGDAKLVSANVVDNEVDEQESNTVETTNQNVVETNSSNEDNNEINNEVVSENKTENIESNDNYFTQTRLERETMYSQMLETYNKIMENEKIPADQKSIASNEIKNISDKKSAISIIENLIKTKGFEDVVLLINDNSINVVVKHTNNLTTEQVAQITNIVSRELKAEIEDIHISVHN